MNTIGNIKNWRECIQRLITLQGEMRVPGYISSKHARMLGAIIYESTNSLNNEILLEKGNREQEELRVAEAFKKLRKGGLINNK